MLPQSEALLKKRSLGLWALAFLLTLLLAVYQRLSGPTYPIRGKQTVPGSTIRYKFYRSWTSHKPLPVRVTADGEGPALRLHHVRFPFPADAKWTVVDMRERDGAYEAEVPGEPAAGKVAYKVEVTSPGKVAWLDEGKPVVARFKDEVPAWLLILHILFMFAAMILAFRAGLGALVNEDHWQRLVFWTLLVTALGGLLLGPLVQKYAFGALWTGFPLGHDLTDTKVLLVAAVWLAAFVLRKKSRWWIVAATVLMVAVYLIPHSAQGSELDYKTGKVITAK